MSKTSPPLPRRNWLAHTTPAIAALPGCASEPSTAPQLPAPSTVVVRATEPESGEAVLQQGFTRWVAQMRASARVAGIDDATLGAAFDDVHYLPRVVELDRTQPEFTRAVWDY